MNAAIRALLGGVAGGFRGYAEQEQLRRDNARDDLRALASLELAQARGAAPRPMVETVMRDNAAMRVAFDPETLRELGVLGAAPERPQGQPTSFVEDVDGTPVYTQVMPDGTKRPVGKAFRPEPAAPREPKGLGDLQAEAEARAQGAAEAKTREQVKGEVAARQTMLARLDAYEAALNDAQKTGWTPAAIAAVNNLSTAAQMEAKNYAQLGALSGPDMGLIERTLASPVSLRGVVYGDEGRRKQIALLRQQMQGDMQRLQARIAPAARPPLGAALNAIRQGRP